MESIANIRQDYKMQTLDETDAPADPFAMFDSWWQQAVSSDINEVNAMTLATATPDGKPSARIVLLKGYTKDGFVFFTNYQSHKGKELAENNQASIVFFWKELERQVRIEGTIEKVAESESDEYFRSRPTGSKIGAWASPQSAVIPSRDILEQNVTELEKSFDGKEIDRPEHWGGYRLIPDMVEFWQGRPSRLHDRLVYKLEEKEWKLVRLAP
ncbi:MAG: pyridoxamine 5-phosphate oxidase [Ferruginibacter sp.]|nr:pyridoxamine 5-phosphate oxidase [Ferruginibacter sp.]